MRSLNWELVQILVGDGLNFVPPSSSAAHQIFLNQSYFNYTGVTLIRQKPPFKSTFSHLNPLRKGTPIR